jgi:hypothetical protein
LEVFACTLAFWLLTGPFLLLGTTVCFAHLPDPERQFGPVRLWGTVGWIAVAWLVGAWLARPSAPRTHLADAFRIGGVVAFVLAGYSLTLPATPPARARARAHLLAPLAALGLLRSGRLAVYAGCVLGACVTFPLTTQNTPLLLRQVGVPEAWLGPTLTLAQLTEVVSLALLPMLLLRLGVRGTMLLGLSAWALALAVLSLGRPALLVVASQALNGLFIAGFLVAGQVFLNTQAAGDLRASVQGLFSFVNGLGMLAGHLLASGLRHWSGGQLPATFAFGAALTAGLLGVFAVGFREEARG